MASPHLCSTERLINIAKERKKQYRKPVSYETHVLRVVRLVFYVVLFLLVLITGIYGSVLVLTLITQYSQAQNIAKKKNAIDLVVVALFHPSINFVLSILRLAFHRFQKPTLKKILVMTAVEAISSIGEILLIFRAFPYMDSLSVSLTFLCLAVIPTLLQCIQSVRSIIKRRCKMNCISIRNTFEILPFIIQVACSVCFMMFVAPSINTNDNDASDVWKYILVIGVLMKSVGFYENFFRMKGAKPQVLSEPKDSSVYSIHTDKSCPELNDEIHNAETERQQYMTTVLTERADMFYAYLCKSCTKLGVYMIFIILLVVNDGEPIVNYTVATSSNTTSENLEDFNSSKCSFAWTCMLELYKEHAQIIHTLIVSTAFSYCARLACRLNMQKVCFGVPLNLIPIAIGLFIFYGCKEQNVQANLGIQLICVDRNDDQYGVLFALLAGLWVSIAISTWHIWVPYVKNLPASNRLFHVVFTDAFFPVINTHLRRKNDSDIQYATPPEKKEVPKVNVCVTMWHESPKEMIQLLKSLFKLDNRVRERKLQSEAENVVREDDMDIEIHIVFDNAFERGGTGAPTPNEYATQFLSCVEEAGKYVLGDTECRQWLEFTACREKSPMPYGGRLTWTLPGGTKMQLHLKDKRLVRIKKRSSQVMYLYYSLLFGHDGLDDDQVRQKLRNTFILTLDGDVDFEPECVWQLMYRMQLNPDVGAVSGRVHPIGSGPLAWYQQFEYSMINWLNKATEHVFGCVLCCSGCFSLYRGSAIVADNVLKTYTRLPTKGKDLLVHEQGEDRWLCYLVQKQGYKVEFCPDADAKTYAPEDLSTFYIQRKRWAISTVLHTTDLLRSSKKLIYTNPNFSVGFIIYIAVMFALEILSPSLIINSINGRLTAVLGISVYWSFLVLFAPVFIFSIICMVFNRDIQLTIASIFTGFYSVCMILVTIYIIIDIGTADLFKHNFVFIIFVLVVCVIAALTHPKELLNIAKGPLFYVLMPATYIFLTVFYVCNMNDASWGTRETKEKPAMGESKCSFDQERNWLFGEDTEEFSYVELTHENEFWRRIIHKFLKPLKPDPKSEKQFKEDLDALRNKWIFGFLLTNAVAMVTLMMVSANRHRFIGDHLPANVEPDLLFVESIFAAVILFQLFGMVYQRWNNILHLLANSTLRTVRNKKSIPPAAQCQIQLSNKPLSYLPYLVSKKSSHFCESGYAHMPEYLKTGKLHTGESNYSIESDMVDVQGARENAHSRSSYPIGSRYLGSIDNLARTQSDDLSGYSFYKAKRLTTSVSHPSLAWSNETKKVSKSRLSN